MSAPGQRHSPFPIVMRGYDRDQVTDHIRRLEAELQMMTADRDSAYASADEIHDKLEDARNQIYRLQQEVDTLSVPPTTVAGMSERVSRMLQLATDEAAELRTSARDEADETLSVARQSAQQAREEATTDADRTKELAQEHADSLISDAEKRTAEIDADGEQAKRESKRTEETAHERARTIIQAAESDAARLRGAAHSISMNRLARSRELAGAAHDAHQQVLDHLEALRHHLGDLPDALALSGDELDLVAQDDSNDLDLLNRTLVGRDRFDDDDAAGDSSTTDTGDDAAQSEAAESEAAQSDSTDVLTTVADDDADKRYSADRYPSDQYGTTRRTEDEHGRTSASA